MSKDVRTIVKKFLEDGGYDGLYSERYECACLKDDLFPCEYPLASCAPGRKADCKPGECPFEGECDWHIKGVPE